MIEDGQADWGRNDSLGLDGAFEVPSVNSRPGRFYVRIHFLLSYSKCAKGTASFMCMLVPLNVKLNLVEA